jgi:hypothetical protein
VTKITVSSGDVAINVQAVIPQPYSIRGGPVVTLELSSDFLRSRGISYFPLSPTAKEAKTLAAALLEYAKGK